MVVVCAWCAKSLGEKAPFEDRRVSHGVCPDCRDKLPKKKVKA